jgi:hypothetical protein
MSQMTIEINGKHVVNTKTTTMDKIPVSFSASEAEGIEIFARDAGDPRNFNPNPPRGKASHVSENVKH